MSISTGIFDQDGVMPNSAGLSNLFVAWGQFLDHDLSLSPENHAETISAPGLVAPLERSEFLTDADGVRTPVNGITWQIDASNVYGSTQARTDDLRSFEGGKLRISDDSTSDHGLMPKADPDSFMAGDITSDNPVYLAGDVRANENPALSSVHTLMMREHNYWADKIAQAHPDWDDDQIFAGAREIVTYEIQKITYDSWLPHLIGDRMGADTGFDPEVNGQVSVEFSTAAFRFGHTMVSSSISRLDEAGDIAEGGNLDIRDAFFNADIIKEYGIDSILRGQMATNAQEADTKVIDDLNFFLQTPNGMSGFSLVALNLLRSQDHGLQSYVDTRAALLGDIDPATIDPSDFSVITSDPNLQAAFAAVYSSVHDVELWVGGLAEDNLTGGQFGATFTHIIIDQFTRTRAGDANFGHLSPALGEEIIAAVKASSLSDVMLRNTEIDTVQDDPFLAVDRFLTDADVPQSTWGNDTVDIAAKKIIGDITTRAGNDTVTVTGGSHIDGTICLADGDDTYGQSSGTITGNVHTGSGDDTVTLRGSGRVLGRIETGTGDDTVTLSEGAQVGDSIVTGKGSDTVTIGARAHVGQITTGNDNDSIVLKGAGLVDHVDGGEWGKTDYDTLKIQGTRFRIDWFNDNPTSEAGTVVYLNADGTETGEKTTFRNVEAVTCFTPGTRIIAARGMQPIETLKVGDRVMTIDQGLQTIRWIGRTTVAATGSLAPIRILAGALGNTHAMEVSPQHRMLVSGWRCAMVCGEEDVLIAARHLINDSTIRPRTGGTVDYIHILFDDHQIVLAEGIPSESFHPGAVGLGSMDKATRAELLALFPELESDPATYGPAARYTAKAHEARVILEKADLL